MFQTKLMTTITIGMGTGSSNTTGSQYRYWSFGDADWREGIRDDNFVRDKTLTGLGWDGAEDTDWENVYEEIY